MRHVVFGEFLELISNLATVVGGPLLVGSIDGGFGRLCEYVSNDGQSRQ